MKTTRKKIILLLIIITVFAYTLLSSFNLNEASLQFASSHTTEINEFINKHFTLSLLIYFLCYMILLSIGFPMGAIFAIISGYFFDLSVGVAITMLSAVLSSLLTFYIGKHFLYRYLHQHYDKKIKKIVSAINKHGVYYVLAVRVSSIFPFFWVNLFFGASNLSYKQYTIPTFLGLIPGTLVYVNMGVSLSSLNSIEDIFSFKILFSFVLLATLVLLPLLIKKFYPNISN